jgi:hypothetical protein
MAKKSLTDRKREFRPAKDQKKAKSEAMQDQHPGS